MIYIENNNNINYIRAYTEVYCLLECLPYSYTEKIPKKLIEFIKTHSSEKYRLVIDTNKSLLEQNFSKKTKDLIAVIKYNYWSTEEEKKQLKKIFYENENKYQKDLSAQYDIDDIFKKKKTKINLTDNEGEPNLQMLECKENIFMKILNKMKNIFRKQN